MTSIHLLIRLFLLLAAPTLFASANAPLLKLPEEFTWKDVFNVGLRPKHVSGLERKKTECIDQELIIQINEGGQPFGLDSGRLSIELMHDDRIRLLMHTSRVPITMEEGELRQEQFRKLFPDHLVRPGTMPVIMDKKSGAVMAVSDQYVIAKVDQHVFSYGFSPSFQKERPLIANFQLCWIHKPGEDSPPIRRKIVEPPAGYEWYSLDPKVHTPDPSGVVNAKDLPESSSTQTPESTRPERREKSPEATPPQATKSPWPVWIVLLALLFPIGLLLKRRFSKE